MQERFYTALAEGMEVYDTRNDKIGTVGGIYRPASAVSPTAAAPATYVEPAADAEPYFKVSRGFLGFGKDLFIPAGAITDVTGNRVTLNVEKDRLGEMGWDQRPPWIPES